MKCLLSFALFVSWSLVAGDSLSIPSNETIELDRIQQLEQKLTALEQKIKAQRAELKMLKDSMIADRDSDSRMVLGQVQPGNDCVVDNSFYSIDGREVKAGFDSFLSEGKHQVKVELTCSYNNKLFTYMNSTPYKVIGSIDVELKAGRTDYVAFSVLDKQLKIEVKSVAHNERGRGILPVSDVPHLLPGSVAKPAQAVVLVARNAYPKSKLGSLEIELDGKRLKNTKAIAEMAQGQLVYEGAMDAGNHNLKATIRFELEDGSTISVPYVASLTVVPGFKTEVVLGKNRKVQVKQEAI